MTEKTVASNERTDFLERHLIGGEENNLERDMVLRAKAIDVVIDERYQKYKMYKGVNEDGLLCRISLSASFINTIQITSKIPGTSDAKNAILSMAGIITVFDLKTNRSACSFSAKIPRTIEQITYRRYNRKYSIQVRTKKTPKNWKKAVIG